MKKKIAINLWILRNKNYDGLGVVAIETISRMIANNPDVDFLLMVDKKFTEDFFDYPNAIKYYIFPALRHPILYLLYFETVVPYFLKKYKVDCFLSMDGFISLISNCKQVSLLADINFYHFPKDIPLRNRIYYNFFCPLFAKKATRIATLSEFSKQDIFNAYKPDISKIDVIYCGIRDGFKPISAQEKIEIKNKVSGGKDYFFFVGSMNPRKNISGLINAFNLFKQQTKSNMMLVLAGNIVWQEYKVKNNFNDLEFKNDIVFLGRVSDEDLNKYLGSAFALCFVPLFEGFGLPVVEAWACDVPVIASNITSVPEIGGNAVLMADPYNVENIALQMAILLANTKLKKDLVFKGNVRKMMFTWQNTSNLLWDSISKIIKQ